MKGKMIGDHKADDQMSIVELLTATLDEAIKGNITSVAIAACMQGGFATVMAGRQAGDLNLACDELKAKILAAVIEGTTERTTRKSSILRPQ